MGGARVVAATQVEDVIFARPQASYGKLALKIQRPLVLFVGVVASSLGVAVVVLVAVVVAIPLLFAAVVVLSKASCFACAKP